MESNTKLEHPQLSVPISCPTRSRTEEHYYYFLYPQ